MMDSIFGYPVIEAHHQPIERQVRDPHVREDFSGDVCFSCPGGATHEIKHVTQQLIGDGATSSRFQQQAGLESAGIVSGLAAGCGALWDAHFDDHSNLGYCQALARMCNPRVRAQVLPS
jgi:hypothetical protein